MTEPRRVPTEVERTAGHVHLGPLATVIARLGVALEESRREVHRLHAEVAERTRERDDARRLADLTTEQEAANAQIIVATRQMFNDANARLRHLLLAALEVEDDDRTPLSGYVRALTAQRDQARAGRLTRRNP